MPNTNPFVSTIEQLNEKISSVKKKACIDFGFFVGPDINSDISKLSQLTTAFKLYTAKSVENVAIEDEYQLSGILEKIAQIFHY